MKPLLMIGIDGLPAWECFPFIQLLPRICDALTCRVGILESARPINSLASWTSILTSSLPKEHGLLDFFIWDWVRKEFTINRARSQRRYYWENHRLLGDGSESENINERSIIINVPGSVVTYGHVIIPGLPKYVLPDISSIWRAPGPIPAWFRLSVKNYKIERGSTIGIATVHRDIDKESIIDGELATLVQRQRIAEYALKNGGFTFVGVVFTESDRILHYFARETIRDSVKISRPLRKFWSALDRAVARLYNEGLKRGYNIIIVSDHGFRVVENVVSLPTFLEGIGMSRLGRDGRADAENSLLIPAMASSQGIHISFKWRRDVTSRVEDHVDEICRCLNDKIAGSGRPFRRFWNTHYPRKIGGPEIMFDMNEGCTVTSKIIKCGITDVGGRTGAHDSRGMFAVCRASSALGRQVKAHELFRKLH